MAPPKKRKTWKMNEAVGAVLRKEMGNLNASKYFGVPQTTLERYVKQRRLSPTEEDCPTTKLGADLIQHCLLMEERFFGIMRADLRRLAYRLAVANNIPVSFNVKNEAAGKKWLKDFLKRHAEILFVKTATRYFSSSC
jgi:hypothetical protein